MNTNLHSFIDIFGTTFAEKEDSVILRKIIIPIIQRDYAQGRVSPDVNRVRSRFLDSLHNAVTQTPVTLDFVYGDINADGIMTPLDGQQRLTTLFLLHWYAAKKSGRSAEECAFLTGFSYETRYSARYFCEYLTKFTPSFFTALSDEIVDQPWFPLEWKKDPTINSMLVMLDAIQKKFQDVDDLWEKLKNGAITFYFLPIKDMGLTDDLYIKMNSRGKPLTRFEHFKAEFERCIRVVDEDLAKKIMLKIDRNWTDMLWRYRDSGSGTPEDVITDDEFLKYFHFICDIICYQRNESPQGKSTDEFDLLSEYFCGDSAEVRKNVKTLESYFDCWCAIDGFASPKDFLESCMSFISAPRKIVIDSKSKIDIFEDCLHNYADKSGKLRQFPLNRIILLYAIICFLRNRACVSHAEFSQRLRVVNNLIQNSVDEISDRRDRNRIPAILQQINAIILTGKIDDAIDNNFSVNQIREEKEKKAFLAEFPEKALLVFELEDHPNLKGQISIVGLDHVEYAKRFTSLLSCDWDLVDRALMAIGDYGQMERNKWRYQYGSKSIQLAWDNLFHRSANTGFERTHDILIALLEQTETFSNESLQKMINSFIQRCERTLHYPWRYYYVKYDAFRPGSFGKYYNFDVEKSPYLFCVMQTKSQPSQNSYLPYFWEADQTHAAKDSFGQRLVYANQYVTAENDAYVIHDKDTDVEVEKILISQDETGIDTEDRILCLRQLIQERFFRKE